MSNVHISVQEAEFDQNAVYHWLSESHSVGATVIFVGKVRDLNLGDDVSSLYLEYYPAFHIFSSYLHRSIKAVRIFLSYHLLLVLIFLAPILSHQKKDCLRNSKTSLPSAFQLGDCRIDQAIH